MSLREKLTYKRWKFKEGADFSSSHPLKRTLLEIPNTKEEIHHEIEGYYPKLKPKDYKPIYFTTLFY